MKDYEKMTVKELVDELTSLGVSFNKKSRKADLLELLLSETAENSNKSDDKEISKKAAPVAESPEAKKSSQKTSAKKEISADSSYAIIRTGGKQYQVSTGSRVRVEKIAGDVGDAVELKDVLVVFDGNTINIGQPTVEGAVVAARIVEQGKAKKVLVFKKKRRKGYRVKRGHRQMFTALEISGISV